MQPPIVTFRFKVKKVFDVIREMLMIRTLVVAMAPLALAGKVQWAGYVFRNLGASMTAYTDSVVPTCSDLPMMSASLAPRTLHL